jgi:hypothetical protein
MIKGEGNKMGKVRIWVSLIRERKRCKGKTLEELTNTKRSPTNRLPWHMPIEEIMTNKALEEE